MSDNGYMIWLVAMAVVTIAILTVGTLTSAGIITWGRSPERDEDRPEARTEDRPETRTEERVGR